MVRSIKSQSGMCMLSCNLHPPEHWYIFITQSGYVMHTVKFTCSDQFHTVFLLQLMLMSIPQCSISEIPDTLSQWYRIWFWLSISGNSSEKLHCGNAVNIMQLSLSLPPLIQLTEMIVMMTLMMPIPSVAYWVYSTGIPADLNTLSE